jgi:hypothetical protein
VYSCRGAARTVPPPRCGFAVGRGFLRAPDLATFLD